LGGLGAALAITFAAPLNGEKKIMKNMLITASIVVCGSVMSVSCAGQKAPMGQEKHVAMQEMAERAQKDLMVCMRTRDEGDCGRACNHKVGLTPIERANACNVSCAEKNWNACYEAGNAAHEEGHYRLAGDFFEQACKHKHPAACGALWRLSDHSRYAPDLPRTEIVKVLEDQCQAKKELGCSELADGYRRDWDSTQSVASLQKAATFLRSACYAKDASESKNYNCSAAKCLIGETVEGGIYDDLKASCQHAKLPTTMLKRFEHLAPANM